MNFYDEMQTGQSGISSALAKLDQSIIEMKILMNGLKPERNFKTGQVKRYFNIDGSPEILLQKLEWIKQTFKN